MPQDAYNKLKKQLKDLQRRHNEFRNVLLGSGNVQQVSIGEMSFGMISMPLDYTLPHCSFTEQVSHSARTHCIFHTTEHYSLPAWDGI